MYVGDAMRLKIEDKIEQSGYKKRYIAQKIGVNENTLTNWIMGRSWPRLDKAAKLAHLLECKVDDLFELKSDR